MLFGPLKLELTWAGLPYHIWKGKEILLPCAHGRAEAQNLQEDDASRGVLTANRSRSQERGLMSKETGGGGFPMESGFNFRQVEIFKRRKAMG